MSGDVTRGQALELQSRFGLDTNWNELDGDSVQQQVIQLSREELGRRFTAFLRNGAQIIIGEPRILRVNRSQPFNPATFIGEGWTIWKGPADGDGLSGDEEQDSKSLALTEIDITRIQFDACLEEGESWVNGEERQKRLKKAGRPQLDLKVLQVFWENQALIPEASKRMANGNVRYMYFTGTVLRSPYGSRYILYLYYDVGRWGWDVHFLGHGFSVSHPSVVLAS